jgi:hypothetical protein
MKTQTGEGEAMSIGSLLNIRKDILRVADGRNLQEDLSREIARIAAPFDDGRTALAFKREILELIGFIEAIKIRFLRGEVRAKDLHREIEFTLRQFQMRHQSCNGWENGLFRSYYGGDAPTGDGGTRSPLPEALT